MEINANSLLPSLALCCTLLSGGYFLTIAPLKYELEKQQIVMDQAKVTATIANGNTASLGKQDIRIEQNRKQIQLGEINAAKREVQMDHLTEAIRQLNQLLKDMNKGDR